MEVWDEHAIPPSALMYCVNLSGYSAGDLEKVMEEACSPSFSMDLVGNSARGLKEARAPSFRVDLVGSSGGLEGACGSSFK